MEEKGRMKLDVSIGILYTATMALAILFIGLMKSYNAEVYGYLFGSVLSVTSGELRIIGGVEPSLVLGLILLFSKELYFIAFDQERWPRPPASQRERFSSFCSHWSRSPWSSH